MRGHNPARVLIERFRSLARDQEGVRRAIYLAMLATSVVAILFFLFGQQRLVLPRRRLLSGIVMALWAGLHVLFYFLQKRRNRQPVYVAYIWAVFFVLMFVFSVLWLPYAAAAAGRIVYYFALSYVALILLDFGKFLAFSSSTTLVHLGLVVAGMGQEPSQYRGAVVAALSMSLVLHWLLVNSVALLLHRYHMETASARLELQNHNRLLEKEVRVRTELIKKQQKHLFQAEKMEAIGTFAGGLSHDLNNILVGVLGHASLLDRQTASGDPGKAHIQTIVSSAERASRLATQLLTFTRGGKKTTAAVDANRVVDNVATLLSASFPKSIEVNLGLEDGLPAVEGDEARLEQAVLNISLNARDAMPDGGRLSLQTKSVFGGGQPIEVLGLRPGRYVCVIVADTGAGMDGKTKTRMFEPFFTTKGGAGTGLGLTMVHTIVREHGGDIAVESAPGEGTTFTLWLPASKKSVADVTLVEERPVEGSELVLVVDDQALVIGVARRILESLGYRALAATSGAEGIDMLSKHRDDISLVLLDLEMPDKDGLAVFEEMREIEPDIRIILYSGYAVDARIDRALERGAKGFLAKPFDVVSLARKVREVLDAPA